MDVQGFRISGLEKLGSLAGGPNDENNTVLGLYWHSPLMENPSYTSGSLLERL